MTTGIGPPSSPRPTSLTAASAADLFRVEPDSYVAVEGAEVALRSVGTGPDVLFVHGWPLSGATFRSLLPHLVGHVTCHVVDLPGTGSSRWEPTTPLSVRHHVASVRAVADHLGVDRLAVVGHDSGGLIARHALAGDPRVTGMGLIDTELPSALGWRFRAFLLARHLPGAGAGLAWAVSRPRVRRSPLVLGGAFVDRDLLDGEFDDLLLQPLRTAAKRDAAVRILRSFDLDDVRALDALHARIEVPVELVWGAQDPFFPVERVRQAMESFPDAHLTVVDGAALCSHEERPSEVAQALLPALTGAR